MKKNKLMKKIENELECEFLPDTKTHKHRIEIPSESSDNLYIVSQTKLNGIWQCACFGFRRHRHCKHLKAIVPLIEATMKPKTIENKPRKAAKKLPVTKEKKYKVTIEFTVNETMKPVKKESIQYENLLSYLYEEIPDLINEKIKFERIKNE